MKNLKIIFLFVVPLFLVSSCTKIGKNITLKGKILNPLTGEPVANQKIVLYKSKISLEWTSAWKVIQETHSDENGDFEISALRIGKILARIDGFPNDGTRYYALGWDYNGSYYQALKLDKGRKVYADYHLVPYGKLQIHVKNTECYNPDDKVKLYFEGETFDSKTFMKGKLTELEGCIDIVDNPVNSTMGYKYFYWVSIKNSDTTLFYDTIYVDKNQTTTLNVFY